MIFIETDVIVNDDCSHYMQKMPDCCIDLTITSPPYDKLRKYEGFTFDFEGIADHLYRITKPGGVVVWIINDSVVNGSRTGTSFKQALRFMKTGFRLYDTMIWEKPSPAAPTHERYYDVFEYMFIFSKGKPKTLNLLTDRRNKSAGSTSRKETRSSREDRKTTNAIRTIKEYSRRFNVWHMSRGRNKTSHPAVFPEKLAQDHILTWSNPGDLVFDPFVGSGTTAVAARRTNRKYIGIDISGKYCEMAQKRVEQESN